MSNRFLFMALFMALSINIVHAQTSANYAFTTNTTGSLALDKNGNAVDLSSGSSTLPIAAGFDDLSSGTLSLGFDFYLMGNRYTQYSANTNGIIQLGSTAISGTTYSTSGGSVASPRISAFGADLASGSLGSIKSKTVGTAPNRCFIIEFNNMTLYSQASTFNNDGNWQTRLYEDGTIEFVYGSMICSLAGVFDNTAGIGFSTNTSSNNFVYITTSSQTATNSGSFTDNPTYGVGTITALHSTTDGSRRTYKFVPPSPTSAPSGLTFSSITGLSATINWLDNSSNEVGFAIYRSTDNVTYNYVNSVGSGITSLAQTGLTFGTTYYFKVYAFTEGALSAAASGSQATNSPSLSGTKTVGSGGDYNNLTTAFADMNANGLLGPIVLTLIAGYPASGETYPIVGPSATITSAVNTVKVYPTVSGLSISSSNATGTLNFDGSNYITFDGRVNAIGTSPDLIIENTNAGTSYAAQFINDASNITLKYCIIKSRNTSITSGSIVFSTTTGSNGNDNNLIDNCNITDGSSTPVNAIYSLGTASKENSSNTISNCSISNYFSAGSASNGILISTNNNTWTINNNKFFQSAARTITGAVQHSAINITSSSGNSFTISNNIIGYNTNSSTGTYTLTGATNTKFVPISLSVGTTTASNVNSNTITNIAISGVMNGTSTTAPFRAIYISGGLVTTNNNIIGNMATNSSITYTSTSTSASDIVGIFNFSSNNWISNNNSIGGILVSNSSTGAANFYGLRCFTLASATWTCTGNIIGSTVSNSIQSTSTAVGTIANAILNSAPSATITNNTIQNILVAGGTGTLASASIIGISNNAVSANHTISQNTIKSLSNSNTTSAVTVTGIYFTGSTGTNNISKNSISGLSIVSGSSTAILNGISVVGGTASYSNNIISLGKDASNSSLTNAFVINGFNETGGTNNFYFNTVYISGSGVNGGTGSTYALKSTVVTNTRNYKNNIFYNARSNGSSTGKNFAIQVGGTSANPAGLTSSNNDLYVDGTGGTFGFFNSSDVTTLAGWQVATAQDVNSVSANPNFTSTTDLHINTATVSYLESGGANIAGINDDYDGDTRNASAPDIGADEFVGIPVSITVADGNWNTPATWLGGIIPPANADVTIAHNVTLTADEPASGEFNTITVNASKTLNLGGQNLKVKDLTNNGTITSASGELQFTGVNASFTNNGTYNHVPGSLSAINTGTFAIQGTNMFVINSFYVYCSAVTSVFTQININQNLNIENAAVTFNKPILHNPNCNLNYEFTGTRTPGNEWLPNLNSGIGVPARVVILSAATIDFGASTQFRACRGDISIEGTLVLSTDAGGYLKTGGDIFVYPLGVLTTNDTKVELNSTGVDQTIQKVGGTLSIANLVINSSGAVVMDSDVEIVNSSGTSNLDILANATINLNNHNLNFSGSNNGSINLSTFTLNITSPTSTGKFSIGTGIHQVTGNLPTASLIFNYPAVVTTNSIAASTIDFGNNITTIGGQLEINHPNTSVSGQFTYGTSSALVYNHLGLRNFNLNTYTHEEWFSSINVTNQPNEVTINGDLILDAAVYNAGNYLTINSGKALSVDPATNFELNGSITANGTLGLGSAQNLILKGSTNCEIYMATQFPFNNTSIELQKTGLATVKLTNSIPNEFGGIWFQPGNTANFDLNGSNNFTLDAVGQIQGEGANGKIINTGNPTLSNGYVGFAAAGAPITSTLTNFGGLGLELASNDSPTLGLIRRFPHAQSGVGTNPSGSVQRVYEVGITPASQITYTYTYFDSELNGVLESDPSFSLFTSASQNGTYANIGTSSKNIGTNELTQSEDPMDGFFITASSDGSTTVTSKATGGLWSVGSSWVGNQSPATMTNPTVIIDGPITVDLPFNSTTETVNGITINAGKTLTFAAASSLYVGGVIDNNGSIVMDSYSDLHLFNNATLDNTGGTLIPINNTSIVTFEQDGSLLGSITYDNIMVKGVVNFDAGITINNLLFHDGTGAQITGNAPIYGPFSGIKYMNGPSVRGLEWIGNTTTNPGYPHNVVIDTQLDLGGADVAPFDYKCSGDVTINNGGELNLAFGNFNGGLYANNMTVNGSLVFSNTNDLNLLISGNLTVGASASISYATGSSIIFNGSGTQTFQSAIALDIEQIGNAQTASNTLQLIMPDITLRGANGAGAIRFGLNPGTKTIDLNGTNVLINDPLGSILTNIEGVITSTGGESTITFDGGGTHAIGSTAALTFDSNVILTSTVNTITLDFSSGNTTINHKFLHKGNDITIVGAPNYGTGSTLIYDMGSYGTGSEWATDASSGAGVPYNVEVYDDLQLNGPGTAKYVRGNVTTILGANLDIGPFDLRVNGNFTNNGDFFGTPGYLEFVGNANSTFSSTSFWPIPSLKINKTTSNNSLLLNTDLTIDSELKLQSGKLNLNGAHIITLNTNASIANETASNTFTNNSYNLNGYIETTRHIDNVTDNNFGGIGLTAIATGNNTYYWDMAVRRYPKYNGVVSSGTFATDNLFRLVASNFISPCCLPPPPPGYILRVDYNYQNLGINAAGSLNLWSSADDNSNFTMLTSTDNFPVESVEALVTADMSPLFITLSEAAYVPVTKTTANDNGNWSVATDWSGGTVPHAGDNIIINNTGFKMDISNQTTLSAYGSLTVNSTKSLIVKHNNDVYFSGAITNNGTLSQDSGTAIHTIGNVTFTNNGIYTINTDSLYNFNMHDGGTIAGVATTFSGLTIGGAVTATAASININDSLKINSVGSWGVGTKPTYNSGSSLVYATGSNFSRGNEWSATSGPGYPYNVTISNSSTVNLSGGQPSVARAIANKLSLIPGSSANSTLNMNTSGDAMQASLTVKSIDLLRDGLNNTDGHIDLSVNPTGKLVVQDGDILSQNWYNIWFTTTSVLEIKSTTTTQYLNGVIWPGGGTIIFNNTFDDIRTTSSCEIDSRCNFTFKDGSKGLQNIKLTMNGSNSIISMGTGSRNISGSQGMTFYSSGTFTFSGTGSLQMQTGMTFNNGAGSVNFGINKVIIDNATLSLNSGATVTGYPTYTSNSTVQYYLDGTVLVGSWWQPCGSLFGVPNNVIINSLNSNSTLDLSGNNYCVNGSYTHNGTASSYCTASLSTFQLRVKGDVTVGQYSFLNTNGGSSLLLNGTTTQNLFMHPLFGDLTINNPSGVKLLSDLQLSDNGGDMLTFISGSLDLNGHVLDLDNTGIIVGENNTNRIFETGNTGIGYVKLHTNFGGALAIDASNNHGIGFEATTTDVAGFTNTIIERYYKNIAFVGAVNNIDRVYELTCPDALIPVKATLKFFGSELGGNSTTANMKVYRSNTFSNFSQYLPTAATTNSFTNVNAYSSAEQTTQIMPNNPTYFTAANTDAAYVGVYNIGVPPFNTTIEQAVTLLNASGVGTGGATIIVPSGNITLTSPLDFNFGANEPTASNPLIITGDVNNPPTIYSYAGGTNDRDAFVRVLGTDYLTLQNINFVENPANNNQLSTMEWGIALLKSGPGNGIRFNTISNCTITMHPENSRSVGIYVGNHNTDPGNTYTTTVTSGVNSNNIIHSNTVIGANTGIFVNSYDNTLNDGFQDTFWQIGDTITPALGNHISNFGGATPYVIPPAVVPPAPPVAYGIRCKNTNQVVIGNNIINNIADGGVACNNTIKGIEVEGSSNAASFIKYNNVSLKQGANAFSSYGVVGNMSGSQSINIERNSIHDNEMVSGASGNFYGIYSSTPPSTINVKNNRVSHNTNINSTGSFTGVYNLGSSNVNVTGNKVDTTVTKGIIDSYGYYINSGGTINCLSNSLIDYEQQGTGGGTFYGYCNDNAVVSAFQAGGGHEEISYNNFSKIKVIGATNIFGIATSTSTVRTKGTSVNRLRTYTAVDGNVTGVAIRSGSTVVGSDNKINNYKTKGNIDGLRMIDGTAATLDNDSIYNMTQLDNGNTAGINSTIAPGMTTSARMISNNNISNLSNSGGAGGTTYGILHASSGNGGPHTSTNTGNRIIGLTGNGSGATSGILHASSGTGGPKSTTSNNNVIQTIAGNGSGATYGILHASSGTGGPKSSTTNNNTVTGVSGTGGGSTYGILHASSGNGGPHTSSRIGNTISNITNTGSGNAYGILHASSTTGGAITQTYTTRNNSINGVTIGAGGTGSTYGILHASSGTGGPHQQRISSNSIQNISTINDSAIAIKVVDADSVNLQFNTVGNVRSTGTGTVSGLVVDHFVGNTVGIIANNVIGDMRTTNASGPLDLKGIEIAGAAGTALKLYYNTIVLNDVNTNAGFGSASLLFDNASSIDLRNNIIINKSTTTPSTGVASVLRQIGAGGNFASTSNNNLYYVDSTQNNIAFFSDGINPNVTSFSAYKASVAPSGRETNSFKEDAVFMSLNLASAGYLRLDSLVATKAESGASIITTVTTDRNGAPRFGAVGYVGGGSAPDIGAFEGMMTPAMHVWLGKTSTNWATATNWTANKLPVATDDVIIPKVTTPNYQPTVSTAAAVKDISVQKGTTITLNAADLTFSGNAGMYGAGSPNNIRVTGTGTLVTTGNGNTISGSWLVDNFAKAGTSTTTTISAVATQLNVLGVYTPLSGTMVTNDKLALVSNSSGTGAALVTTAGQIAPTGTGTFSGNVTIQRKMPSTAYATAHMVSSPITNANTVVSNYGDNVSVVGDAGYQATPGAAIPLVFPTAWWFNPYYVAPLPTVTTEAMRWVSATGAFTPAPGVGISITTVGNAMLDVKGTPQNTSTINLPVKAGRLNLVGNPYPSTIDLDAFLADNTSNIGGNVVYYSNGGTYISYSSAFGGTIVNNPFLDNRVRFMGHSTGFWLYGKGLAGIDFKNTQRNAYPQLSIAAATGSFYESTQSNVLRVKIKNIADAEIFDETVIGSDANAMDGIDDIDGNKFMIDAAAASQPYIYTVADGQNLVINAIPNTNGKVIPLGIITSAVGNWVISTENSDGFVNEVSSLYLEDRSTSPSTYYNLKANPTVQFSLPEGNVGSRFYLHIADQTVNAATAVKQIQASNEPKVFTNTDKLYVDFGTELKGTTTVEVFDMTGQNIANIDATNYQGQHEINLNTTATGNYIVKVINQQNVVNQKVWLGKK